MLNFNLLKGEVTGEPAEIAQFWVEYLKRMSPGLEEQIKSTAEEKVRKEFREQYGTPSKA